MSRMTIKDFKDLKQSLKGKTVMELAIQTDFSATTLRRVKKSKSFKGYKELCSNA